MLLLFVAGMSISATGPTRPLWTITRTVTAHHMMVVDVDARSGADVDQIRRTIVARAAGHYDEILIYVRSGASTLRRIQWTPQHGFAELLISS